MKVISLSPIHLRILLMGLCAVFTIASAFAEGRVFLALVAAAGVVVIVLRMMNLKGHPPAQRFALSCLMGAIFAISAWKEHWGWIAIVAFAVSPVLLGLMGFMKRSAQVGGPDLDPETGDTSTIRGPRL